MRILIVALAATLLSGCAGLDTLKEAGAGLLDYFGGADNAEPPTELKDLEPTVKLNKLWDHSVGKGYDEKFVNLVPAVSESRVYAADHRGTVEAYDRISGDRVWSVDTDVGLSAGPVVEDDKLILGTGDAELLALNTADGGLVWKSGLSSEVLALPRIKDGIVVVRTSDGRLTGLDLKTGGTRWTHDRSVPALSVRTRGSPGVADDLVLDGFASGKLQAIGLSDGKPAWEATVAVPHGRSEVDRLVDMDPDPVIRGETVFVTGYHAGVDAVNLKDGEVLWRQDNVSSHVGMAADRRNLFVTDTNSDVWKLEMRNGSDLWKQADLHQRRLTAPALVKDYVVVGDFEGYLHLLSQEDGSLVGRLRIDDEPIDSTPVVVDDVIYVYSNGGELAAVAVE